MKKTSLFFSMIAFLVFAACTTSTDQRQTDRTDGDTVLGFDLGVDRDADRSVDRALVELKDHGSEPFVFDIEAYTTENDTYRTSILTGEYMQMTVMSIPAGGDIGLEMHPDIDQFLRVEAGSGIVMMGDEEDDLDFEARVEHDFAIFIPAGKWHNLVNDSDEALKVYSIYSPSEHPHSTVHQTQAEGIEAHATEHGH